MGYGELERCKDFNKLSAVFDDRMLKYFQKQLEDYLSDSSDRPVVACWWEGIMSTKNFVEMYK